MTSSTTRLDSGVTVVGQHAALGGDGWIARGGAHRDNHGAVWAAFGLRSECGRLRSVLLHRPGREIEAVADARAALWIEVPDAALAREQHDQLAAIYQAYGVTTHYVGEGSEVKPNLYFMRDTFAMTPEGAILARPASRIRAGEERIVAQALAQLGIPIVMSIYGHGTFEGADLLLANPDLALIGRGLRTNRVGAAQVASLLANLGMSEIAVCDLDAGCLHLDCAISIVDHTLALVDPRFMTADLSTALRRHGMRVVAIPEHEASCGMAINMVTVEPGLVVMPAHNPETRSLLERLGVTCIEADISALMKGGGAVHCITGVLYREG